MPVLKVKKNGVWREISGAASFDEEKYYTKEEVSALIEEAIEAIPTPDVSGQIDSHNSSTSAHTDIRNLISNINIPVQSVNNKTGAVSLGASDVGAPSTSDFTGHTGDSTVHITSTERENWNLAKTNADSAYNLANSKLGSSSEINGGTW